MRINLEMEMKSLALSLRASVAKNLKIQAFLTLASPSKRWVVHELPLATYQKDESKGIP
jgi:hypothetical protein